MTFLSGESSISKLTKLRWIVHITHKFTLYWLYLTSLAIHYLILGMFRDFMLPVSIRLHVFLFSSLGKWTFYCLIPSIRLVKNDIFLFFLPIVWGLSFKIWLNYFGKLSCCEITFTDLSLQWKLRNTNVFNFTSCIFLLSCRFWSLVFIHVLLQSLRNVLLF